MQPVLEAEWILRQNTPFSQKAELMSLLEDSKEKVHSSLLDTLYKQINSVRRIDFAEIDKSKGIYSKLSFKEDLDTAHKCLEESGMCAKELATIKTAAHNIEKGKNMKEKLKPTIGLNLDYIVAGNNEKVTKHKSVSFILLASSNVFGVL